MKALVPCVTSCGVHVRIPASIVAIGSLEKDAAEVLVRVEFPWGQSQSMFARGVLRADGTPLVTVLKESKEEVERRSGGLPTTYVNARNLSDFLTPLGEDGWAKVENGYLMTITSEEREKKDPAARSWKKVARVSPVDELDVVLSIGAHFGL